MARNSTSPELQLLKVLPPLHKGSFLLVQIDKGNALDNFIFLKRNLTILNQLGHLLLINKVINNYLLQLFLSFTVWKQKHKSALYHMWHNFKNSLHSPMLSRNISLLFQLGIRIFLTIHSHAPKDIKTRGGVEYFKA